MDEEEMVNCDLCGERIKKDDAVDDCCGKYYCSWCVENEGVFGDICREDGC